jgi:hypothetical protein
MSLARLIDGLRRIGDCLAHAESTVAHRVAELAAPGISSLIDSQFDTGTGPAGPWAPLSPRTLRKHGPPPLTDTGAMRASLRATPGSRGPHGTVTVRFSPRYTRFHQTGTRHMPRRLLVPRAGLPSAWREVLRRASEQATREAGRP